jgi:hypothetical protein
LESESKKIISFVFKRSGKIRLDKSKFYLSLSLDLKWFSPEKAKIFMDTSLEQNLLIEKNNLLEPNFNIYEISIPFGFKPNENFNKKNLKKSEEDILDITNIIFKKYNYKTPKKERIIKNIEAICNEKNIYSNVASLLFLKDLNIDLSSYITLAEDQIINE